MFRVYWRQLRALTPVVTRGEECSPGRHADFPLQKRSARREGEVRSSAFSVSNRPEKSAFPPVFETPVLIGLGFNEIPKPIKSTHEKIPRGVVPFADTVLGCSSC